MFHDALGNLLFQTDCVYENEQFLGNQTIGYTYTPNNQIATLTRAYGAKDARTTTYTYYPSGKIKTKTLPSNVTLYYSYHPLGSISRLDSSDGKIHHTFEYNRLGHLQSAHDENQDITITRETDPWGNVIEEQFPCGLKIEKEYDPNLRLTTLKIPPHGEIQYTYDPLFLKTITRISNTGKVLYEHSYDQYDMHGNLISESLIGNAGQVIHGTSLRGQKASISSPYFSQECAYDPASNLINATIDGTEHLYSYDGLSQLSSENSTRGSLTYTHDSLYNRTQKNGNTQAFNDLNEFISTNNTLCSYDLDGNQKLKQTPSETTHYTYDPLNQLIEAISEKTKVNFRYDPLGRRLSKTVYTPTGHGWEKSSQENYLYHGQHEIGAFTILNTPKNLRVLGPAKNNPPTISVEIDGQYFAPLLDVQGNICSLVDPTSQALINSYTFTAFGEELPNHTQEAVLNPWRYASKRFDPELGLIYFGKRYYDPELARWLSTDPAGFGDSINLYQYVLNNPFRYADPDGQFLQVILLPVLIWGAEFAVPSLSTWVAPIVYGAIIGAIGYEGYKLVEGQNAKDDNYSPADDYAKYCLKFDAESEEERKKKYNLEKRSSRPDPDTKAEGKPHTIIERPGPDGQYTTHNGDGTFKQYRGSGKPHGNIARPNVKENKNNPAPTGPRPSKPEVREPRPDEIPKGK